MFCPINIYYYPSFLSIYLELHSKIKPSNETVTVECRFGHEFPDSTVKCHSSTTKDNVTLYSGHLPRLFVHDFSHWNSYETGKGMN